MQVFGSVKIGAQGGGEGVGFGAREIEGTGEDSLGRACKPGGRRTHLGSVQKGGSHTAGFFHPDQEISCRASVMQYSWIYAIINDIDVIMTLKFHSNQGGSS